MNYRGAEHNYSNIATGDLQFIVKQKPTAKS